MTDITVPGESGAGIRSTAAGHAWSKAAPCGWVVDGVDIANVYAELNTSGVGGFAYNGGDSSGLTAVFDGGEAYVAGWLCRDTQSTVELPTNGATTVYVGYDASAVLGDGESDADSENIIVGTDGAFSGEDPRLALYTLDTDSNAITGTTDHRQLKQPIEYDAIADELVMGGNVHIDGATHLSGSVTTDGDVTAGGNIHLSGSSAVRMGGGGRWGRFEQYLTGYLDSNDAVTAFRIYDLGTGTTAATVDSSGNASFSGNVTTEGEDVVSSPDAPTIYVSDTEPNDSDPHLWFQPE